MIKFISLLLVVNFYLYGCIEEKLLLGTPISSDKGSETLENAFNDELEEEFKSKLESNGWVGLQLKFPSRITKIGWTQKGEESNYLLGVFEAANDRTFIDAIPLYMITKEGEKGKKNYATIKLNHSFKYIRYVGPTNKYSVISGLEFYGYKAGVNTGEDEGTFYQPTKLPLVVIHTENSIEPEDKENDINFEMTIIDDGKEDTNTKGKIKLRGNSTMGRPKKPYKIRLDSKERLLDFKAKAKKWNLLSNFYDKTLIRNSLAFKISSLLEMKYTPECRFVDLIFNGEYKGNYNLCDNIEVGRDRVDLDEMDDTCNEEPEISGGYLIEACGYASMGEEFRQTTSKGIVYNIRYPKKDDITYDQLDYITNKFNQLEDEVYSGIFENIDVKSLIKYTLIQELTANMDMLWSTYMTKEREDDTLYFGPVWDFDLAFGNDIRARPLKNDFLFKYSGSAGTMRDFYTKLLSNKKILRNLKETWEKVSEEQIYYKDLISYVNKMNDLIKDSRKLNFIRWDMLTKTINFFAEDLCTFEEQIEFLKQEIKERFKQLDELISNATVESISKQPVNENPWGGFNWGNRTNITWNNITWNNITWNNITWNNITWNHTQNWNWGGNGRDQFRDPIGQVSEICKKKMDNE